MQHIEVIKPGVQTTVQDFPGRTGYWHIGVPPSGPMDDFAFRLGNQILGNEDSAAGLEVTMLGPELIFHVDAVVVLTGAPLRARLNGAEIPQWRAIQIKAGGVLVVGSVRSGLRAYLCIQGGIDVPEYLGSKATFTLGQFGGCEGRALKAGDQLTYAQSRKTYYCRYVDYKLIPRYDSHWTVRVMYGPQGAPDFFTPKDIDVFFATDWRIHHNSNRTGIRLIGPKPEWARADGGEAGLHPSNLHDNPYAIGSIDFTGDMPVILGPDGPSLGGFVCPATVITADMWKLGQLKPDDTVRFEPVSVEQAAILDSNQLAEIDSLTSNDKPLAVLPVKPDTPVLRELYLSNDGVAVTYRQAGDANLLIEYGSMKLDLAYRLRAHLLMQWVENNITSAIIDLTPGIRSLQIHFDHRAISAAELVDKLVDAEAALGDVEEISIPTRRIYLPLSWDDESTQKAVEIYTQSVRDDAPWCPSNIEFIRRINGLQSINDVKDIVYSADYLVMGLGDVYLGAPVATPLDPRHRLVTTKYNPARTWTPENAVGIGGAYLCVYGMEGPGGYQFVGRTLQMWNRGKNQVDFEEDKPWLLRFFDQIRFYPVSNKELAEIREAFPRGEYPLKTESLTFCLKDYQNFLSTNNTAIRQFKDKQQQSFEAERQRWLASGEIKQSGEPS